MKHSCPAGWLQCRMSCLVLILRIDRNVGPSQGVLLRHWLPAKHLESFSGLGFEQVTTGLQRAINVWYTWVVMINEFWENSYTFWWDIIQDVRTPINFSCDGTSLSLSLWSLGKELEFFATKKKVIWAWPQFMFFWSASLSQSKKIFDALHVYEVV